MQFAIKSLVAAAAFVAAGAASAALVTINANDQLAGLAGDFMPGVSRDEALLGKDSGFSSDFGHIEMLVSKEAQSEVWPQVEYWLRHLQLPQALEVPEKAMA